jgi:hypothetical protein
VSKPFTPLAGLLGVHLSQVSKAVHQDWHVHERPIFEWAVWHPAGHVKRYDVPHKVVVEGMPDPEDEELYETLQQKIEEEKFREEEPLGGDDDDRD